MRPGEADAARRLVELAEAGEILLPVSSANLVETGALYGERRVALAKTMLMVSRGWQMRNPLHVRFEEMLDAVEGRPPVSREVFAPQADGFFGAASNDPAKSIPRVLATYDAMVDPEAIPTRAALRLPPRGLRRSRRSRSV